MNIEDKARSINTREEFVSFVRDLSEDFVSNRSSWQNTDIESFLSALAAWVEDMDGFYSSKGELAPTNPEWRHVADMFMAARIYE
jgi:hypothetical protein